MRTALITGVTGQDGAYLTRLLLEKGYAVHGTSRPGVPPRVANLRALGLLDRVALHRLDLLDAEAVTRLLDAVRPDEVYHLASQSSVGRSFEQPAETLRLNVLSTTHLLEALRVLARPARLFHASSGEMYGREVALPITEETPMHPASPYAVAKAAAHWAAASYREAYGLFVCSGILFNHESALRPEWFVTKKIVRAAVEIRRGLRDELRLGNVEVRRDWGYAPAYVEGMWAMLQQPRPDDYVLATGESHTLREFVARAFACVGLRYEDHVVEDPALFRAVEVPELYGDASKARRVLGWDPGPAFDEMVGLLVEQELALHAPPATARAS